MSPRKTDRRLWTRSETRLLLQMAETIERSDALAAEMTRRLGRPMTAQAVLARLRQARAQVSRRGAQEPAPPLARSPAPPPPPAPEFEEEPPTDPLTRAPLAETAVAADDPVEVRARRDETARLRAQVEDLVRRLQQATERQKFLDARPSREPPRILPREHASGVREMTPVVLASDWHVEEPVYPESVAFRNEYNLEVAEARIERFFRAIIWNVEHHRASGRIAIRDLVLWLGGDLNTGYIHPELVENNLLSPVEAIRWLLPRLRDGIASLVDHLGLERIEIPCSHGNHGRTTDKTRVSTGYANSFDWLMYHSLADDFRHDPRVHFEITPSNHQYVEVYGRTIHFTHGDEVKYQGGVGGLGIPLLKAVPMWDRVKQAEVHCIGHWHQLRDYGRAVVNGSLIGFGPYSQRIRSEFEEPKQLMFFMDSRRGKSMLTELWVGEKDPCVR